MYLALSSWEELPSEANYRVSVMLLLKQDANTAEKQAAEIALFKVCSILNDAGHCVEEEESSVEMVNEITLHDFTHYTKWSLDYVSIRNPEHAKPISISS